MTAALTPRKRLRNVIRDRLLFGNEPTPELLAILSIYFVQGILNLARLAIGFFLKDDLGLSPAETSALIGIAALPWAIKPAFGFLSDGLPIAGLRRRPYLIISGVLGSISWLLLATVADSAWSATAAILLGSASVALSDVIVDSLVVERARSESLANAGALQSISWGAAAVGGLLTAYLSGWMLERLDTRSVFGIVATFPLIVALAAGAIAERTAGTTPRPVEQAKRLWATVRQPVILLPTAFIVLWQATPNAESALFFFTTNELGFSPEFLGRVRLVTSGAALLGIWLYQRFFKTVPFRHILGWSTVGSAVLGLTALLLVTHANRALGIDDRWFSLGDSLILTVAGQIAFMPVLVLSARLCPPGVEASLFALLMSAFNLAGLLSQELGALLTQWLGVTATNFDNLWLLVLLTNLSTLLPLFFLGWVPARDPRVLSADEPLPAAPAPDCVAEQPVALYGDR
ncbi:folate/biopterin transporter [Rubidibacter lacunae KORDI 51-2]|uniref:Folate/biopterin transporter n=1 Tax=Rubidibacter lacunae KORDI 51-2 TaxID=582515 RepID=U5DTY0_9CHRO|nr:folate/biopterin family MFS transporter [Rubidibacter lacunae]ERN43130.1 folate/biopterin transporter [Rubidibacter lacunae KORDI 51-2]